MDKVTEAPSIDEFRKSGEFSSGIDYPIRKIYSGDWYLDSLRFTEITPSGFLLRFYGANPEGRRFWMYMHMTEGLFFDSAFILENIIEGFLEEEIYGMMND